MEIEDKLILENYEHEIYFNNKPIQHSTRMIWLMFVRLIVEFGRRGRSLHSFARPTFIIIGVLKKQKQHDRKDG